MSPVNWGDAFVQAMRTVLVTVAGLPTTRCWANTVTEPPHDAASIDDAIVAMDTAPAACGPGAIKRTEATYRVVLYVPLNSDIHAITSLAAAIEAVFWAVADAGTLTVLGNPVDVLRIRVGPHAEVGALYALPVFLAVTFDHP